METALKIAGVVAVAAFGWMMIAALIGWAFPGWGKPMPPDDVRPADMPRPRAEDCTPINKGGGPKLPP